MTDNNVSKKIATVKEEIASKQPKKKPIRIAKDERLSRYSQLDHTLKTKSAGIEYRVETADNPTDGKWVGQVGRLVGESSSSNSRSSDLLILQFSDDSKDVFARSQLVEISMVDSDEFSDVRQKLAELEGYLSDLNSAKKRHKEPDTEAFIEYRFIQSVEAILQTAYLIVGFGGRQIERKEGVGILIQLGIIDMPTRAKFRHLTLVRNKLVHQRDTIEFEEVLRVLPKLLEVSEQFIADVTVFLENTTAELLEARLKEVVGSNQSVAMTPKEAAQMLGVETHTIPRWIKDGRLDGFLFFDGKWKVRRSSVQTMYNSLPRWYRDGVK